MRPLDPQRQCKGDGLIYYNLQAIGALPRVAARRDCIHEQALNLGDELLLPLTHTALVVLGGHDHLQRVAAPEVYLAHSRRLGETIGQ